MALPAWPICPAGPTIRPRMNALSSSLVAAAAIKINLAAKVNAKRPARTNLAHPIKASQTGCKCCQKFSKNRQKTQQNKKIKVNKQLLNKQSVTCCEK